MREDVKIALLGSSAEIPDAGPVVYAAAGLSLASGLAHLWAMPEHFQVWWGHGLSFLAISLAQGLAAVCLLRWPNRLPLLLTAISGTLAVLFLHLLTRMSVISFGSHSGEPERASVLDSVTTAAEVALVFVLTTLLNGTARRRTINTLLALGATLWALRLAGLL